MYEPLASSKHFLYTHSGWAEYLCIYVYMYRVLTPQLPLVSTGI
jgi:hypothetical protein